MTITYGNKTDEIQFPTFSFNNDGALLCAILASASAPTSCTFNGDALTHLGTLSTTARGRTQRVYFINGADIGTFDFACSGGSDHWVKLFSVTGGYDTGTPFEAATSNSGTSTTPAISITTLTANADVFAGGLVGDTPTAGTNTSSYTGGTQPILNWWRYTASTATPGSKTINISCTSDQYGLIGFAIRPSSATNLPMMGHMFQTGVGM